jgi:hypothetical protein
MLHPHVVDNPKVACFELERTVALTLSVGEPFEEVLRNWSAIARKHSLRSIGASNRTKDLRKAGSSESCISQAYVDVRGKCVFTPQVRGLMQDGAGQKR